MCLDQEEGVHGLKIHTEQITWDGALKPLPVEPSVCGAVVWPVKMMDVTMARPGMLRLRVRCFQPASLAVPKGEESDSGFTCVTLCWAMPVREGTEKRKGWWVNCMSQGTSGEWETEKPLGAVQGLLVFRVHSLDYRGPAKDTPLSVLKVLT